MICFVHFNKAGGNTFVEVAKHNCRLYPSPIDAMPIRIIDGSKTVKRNNWVIQPWWRWPAKRLRNFLYSDRYDFFAVELGPDDKPHNALKVMYQGIDYVTVLRDPLDMMLSRYRHLCKFGLYPKMSVAEYMLTHRGNNFMTKMLGYNWKEPDFKRAREKLEQMSAIILIEDFQNDMQVMRRKFGWQDIDVTKYRSGTRSNSNAREVFQDDRHLLNMLHTRYFWDLKLLDYARKIKSEINK